MKTDTKLLMLKDIKVELLERFDRNFETKSFFGEEWPAASFPNHRGSLLIRSARFRRSIRGTVGRGGVSFSSDAPYAGIHNEGGEIAVTERMKKYFWAMYYQNAGGVLFSVKSKGAAKTKKNERLTKTAGYYRNMALMKTGSKIKIPRRQVIGDHAVVGQTVEKIANRHLQACLQQIADKYR